MLFITAIKPSTSAYAYFWISWWRNWEKIWAEWIPNKTLSAYFSSSTKPFQSTPLPGDKRNFLDVRSCQINFFATPWILMSGSKRLRLFKWVISVQAQLPINRFLSAIRAKRWNLAPTGWRFYFPDHIGVCSKQAEQISIFARPDKAILINFLILAVQLK